MTAQDIFGVGIRFVGLALVLWELNAGLAYVVPSGVVHLLLAFLLGLYFLRGASGLVSLSYPGKSGAA